jgi:phosphatidylinositol alpha-mannosyltransferase
MAKAMKIGIVTEYYYPTLGGIQEHVHHFAQAARGQGHDVHILTPNVQDDLASIRDDSGPPDLHRRRDEQNGVIRIGQSFPFLSGGSLARASFGVGLSQRLAEVLRSERFDILHLHSPLMPTLPLAALRLSDCANVGTFHSDIGRSLLLAALAPLIRRYLDRLDVAIGVSETALHSLRRRFHSNWRIVPNGVDFSAFASGRRRPEFDDGRLNVLHVGRFDPRNGVDRVINTWVGVRRAGIDARLVLVGDGPLRGRYQAMVPSSLRGDVHFAGFVASSERASYYASGDVLLCPAVGGTFGIIAVEAMAAGCAVVVADTPGFRTIIQDGVQGFMVDVAHDRDCRQLAERTGQLLADAVTRRRCAEAGRRRAAEFDWPKVASQVLRVYDELLTTGGSTGGASGRSDEARRPS